MPDKVIPNVLRRTDPTGDPAPLVFDSPHTGLLYPADFRPAIPMEQCERVADWYVEELFGAAPAHGAVLIEALFRRAYLDPNRSERDLDLSLVEDGWPGEVDTAGRRSPRSGTGSRVTGGPTTAS